MLEALMGVARRRPPALSVREPVAALIAAAFVTAVTLYRLGVIRTERFAGHADVAFYYGAAQNLRAGHGPVINYAWHFLDGQPALPRYAFDYWYPLPSYAMSWAMHSASDLHGALVAVLVTGVVAVLGVYVLARTLTRSWWLPAVAAAIYAVQPAVSLYSITTDSPAFLAATATFALSAGVAARRRPWLWAVCGVFAGVANAARSEGLLLVLAALVVAAAGAPRWTSRLGRLGLVLSGYLVAMAPVYRLNVGHTGTLTSAASSAFPFVRDYEQLFSAHVTRSWAALAPRGLTGFVGDRIFALRSTVDQLVSATDTATLVAMVIGTGVALAYASAQRRRRPSREVSVGLGRVRVPIGPWGLPVATLVVCELFFVLVLPVLSMAALKWGSLIQPTLIIAGLWGLGRLRRPGWTVAAVAVALVTSCYSTASVSRDTAAYDNRIGAEANTLTPLLRAESGCFGRPAVLMTREPWEITLATGYRTVMVPDDDLSTILAVARQYRVTDIQLTDGRDALDDVDALSSGDGPLQAISGGGRSRIYRLRQADGPLVCNTYDGPR